MRSTLALLWLLFACLALAGAALYFRAEDEKPSRLQAEDAFDNRQAVIFQDDFSAGQITNWKLSEDDRYGLAEANPKRMSVVEAPGLGNGRKAVKFVVPRAPNSFRAEISLPHEKGFHDRWYGARVLVPKGWEIDPSGGNDIVLQWHAIPGNWESTYPNLAISVGSDSWVVRQSHGTVRKPTRTERKLDDAVKPGTWISWVVHAKWSPGTDGILQIWRDGKQVIDEKGPNVYSDIGVEYTPYFKTGIYHPAWKPSRQDKTKKVDEKKPAVSERVVYVTDIKIGGEKATYHDIAPTVLEDGER